MFANESIFYFIECSQGMDVLIQFSFFFCGEESWRCATLLCCLNSANMKKRETSTLTELDVDFVFFEILFSFCLLLSFLKKSVMGARGGG